MSDLGFYVDFVSRGAILGLTTGLSSPPEAWVAALGDEFVDTSFSERELVRYFGLVSVSFFRGESGWSCESMIVSAYQQDGLPDGIPRPLIAEFGEFSDRLEFEALADGLVAAGIPIKRRIGDSGSELDTYWVPVSSTEVSVMSTAELARSKRKRVGDVWTVSQLSGTSISDDKVVDYR